MPELNTSILEEILPVCLQGAGEASEALTRALGIPITLQEPKSQTLSKNELPAELNGPGLLVLLTVGSSALAFLLSESSGLVPSWCKAPDATGESKLTTLGQELGMILLPESYPVDDFKCARVENLAAAIFRSEVDPSPAGIGFDVTGGEKQTTAWLLWPLANPSKVFSKPAPIPSPAKAATKPKAKPTATPQPALSKRHINLAELPSYTRSLLRIKVPVVVTLAQQKQPLDRILEIGPGQIIQFEKSCEEMLDLEVNSRKVASGEAIKVGDKFGLRIKTIILPEERFTTIKPPSPAKATG